MEPCMETIAIWIDNFRKSDKTVEEEIKEIHGTISNERIWQKGCSDKEQIAMHEQNIVNYQAYLAWLEEQIG